MYLNNKPHTRQWLLDQGLLIVQSGGLRSLTVRGLCQQAKVNTGSFVYHFGSRERFITELMESWYAPMYAQWQGQLDQEQDALSRLQSLLQSVLSFAYENRALIANCVQDMLAGEAAAMQFFQNMAPRHPQLLLECITQAQQAGQLCPAPPLHQGLFLMAATGMPLLLQQIILGKAVLPTPFDQAFHDFAGDPAHIQQRLLWALKGLATEADNGASHDLLKHRRVVKGA